MSGRPVPWASWEEWQALRDNLWSTDRQRQERGLRQVCAWRLRGKLPMGVDATAHLMDVRRADAEWQRSLAWAADTAAAASPEGSPEDATLAAGELPLRLRYSLPLIRLVNGISDSQQRGRVASSVAVLSDAAGLPRALVDVRHEATHNELPSLPLLRAAADSALAWLWENYWDGQSRALGTAAERIGSLLTALANSWKAATAAGHSCGAGALAAAVEEDENDGDMDPEASGGYNGSEGQRTRRQTMSELRSLVPPLFTHELLQPILDCPVLLPPEPAFLASMPQQQQQQTSVQHRELLDSKAWCSTMKQLLKWYPRLRALLLQAALQRLVAAVSAEPGSTSAATATADGTATASAGVVGVGREDALRQSADKRARGYGLWVLRLLPAETLTLKLSSPTRKQRRASGTGNGASAGGKGAKKATAAVTAIVAATVTPKRATEDGGCSSCSRDDVTIDGPLTLPQLQRLLSITMPAAASVAAADDAGVKMTPGLIRAKRGGAGAAVTVSTAAVAPAGRSDGDPSPQMRILEEVVAALQRAIVLASANSGGGEKATKRQKLGKSSSVAPLEIRSVPVGVTRSEDAVSQPTSVQKNKEAATGECEDAGEDVKRFRQEASSLVQQQQPLPPPRRWLLCTDWSKCAIGCLPCPLNPNGKVPTLAFSPVIRISAPPASQPLVRFEPPRFDSAHEHDASIPTRQVDVESRNDFRAEGTEARAQGDNQKSVEELDYYLESDDAPGPQEAGGMGNVGGSGPGHGRGGGVGGQAMRGNVAEGEEGNVANDEEENNLGGIQAASSLFGELLRRQQNAQESAGRTATVGFLL